MAQKKANLRPVGDDERAPEPRKILTLAEAVATGDYYEILRAQRREIATSIPEESGPAKAALHRQLSLISKEIEALEARQDEAEREESSAAVADSEFDAAAI